jgi:hypothetical protein
MSPRDRHPSVEIERPLEQPRPAAFTACFLTQSGQEVLVQLRRIFLDRRLPPSASTAELWHLEGQRSVVAYMLAMIDRGREPPLGNK